jgi:hypothetical protein
MFQSLLTYHNCDVCSGLFFPHGKRESGWLPPGGVGTRTAAKRLAATAIRTDCWKSATASANEHCGGCPWEKESDCTMNLVLEDELQSQGVLELKAIQFAVPRKEIFAHCCTARHMGPRAGQLGARSSYGLPLLEPGSTFIQSP